MTANTMNQLELCANTHIKPYGFQHQTGSTGGEEETYRTKIRRQRDKILYTGGFRRLQDKTQVMSATLKGDHRTRLTHTLEVEQIAVSVADALGLNKDLVSAIALGHDVGHTPFGHAAERKLNKLLENSGGFAHPIQSVKYLWEKYGEKINDKIYEGILSHDSDMYNIESENAKKQLNYVYSPDSGSAENLWEKVAPFFNKVPSTLEAQVVIWADKIAYITHDLEDFKDSDIYTLVKKAECTLGNSDETLTTEYNLCHILQQLIQTINPRVTYRKIEDFSPRDLIRAITTNLIETSAKNLDHITNLTQNEVQTKTENRINILEADEKKRYLNSLIINFSEPFREDYYKLRQLLDDKYIFSPNVQRSDAKAENIIGFLYNQFLKNYKLTPLVIRAKIDKEFQKMMSIHLGKQALTDKIENLEKIFKELEQSDIEKYSDYVNKRKTFTARIVASYISTMSDTYAEKMFCNLSGSKDNYNL